MPVLARHALIGVALLLLQWLVLGRLQVWGAWPDAVLLFVVWLSLQHGRLVGSIGGFTAGFLMDVIYGTWGIHMLVKTIIGFLAGLFPLEERETLLITPTQALLGGFVVALLHNGLFVILLALQTGARTGTMITAVWLGSAAYTAVVSGIAALFLQTK